MRSTTSLSAALPQTRRARRPIRTALLVLAVALPGLAACTADPGSAAEFDGIGYSQSALGDRVQQVIDEQAGGTSTTLSRQSANRTQLTDVIRSHLIGKAAAAAGISVTPGEVQETVQSSGIDPAAVAQSLQIPLADVPATLGDLVLVSKIATATGGAVTTDVVSTTYEGVVVPDRAAGIALRSAIQADPGNAVALMDATGGRRGSQVISSAEAHAVEGAAGLFRAAVGDVVVVPQANGVVVALITARSSQQQVIQLGTLGSGLEGLLEVERVILSTVAATSAIEVNPRFGLWDPVSVSVVPDPLAAVPDVPAPGTGLTAAPA
ncbi:hypothetical protein GIS00_02230 [Nakamurella sp. YIM 132087]|uniref:Uncharacterized protein n=1 Tax=Nakamurella alba TaxID=2665158 RepID=A0A7K1FF77_9ACTN|nr:hypothetical protein [Nakamurella alba]MTD12762.1 hypothetical protein [Nakamurella alba]